MTDRPNILYFFTDQQFAGAMSCAGNADLCTPAADSLAALGVRFDRAYCTAPLCSPSRSSMFTGLMPHEAGAPRNRMGIGEHLRSREMGLLLSNGGYECAYAGKWHLPGGTITDDHGFQRIAPSGDGGLAEACQAFLARRHDRPFLLVVSTVNPHNICEWARCQRLPAGSISEPDRVEDCPNLPANFAIPAYEPEAIRIEQAWEQEKYPVVSNSQDDWRRYRFAYYRLVEKADAILGRILQALRDGGLEEQTVVIFSSDHGDGHGAHRWNQKSALYEEEVRVPLIVSFKGRMARGRVDGRLVSNGLDLLPMVCDYAGVEPPEGLRGSSLRPLAEGREPAQWRDQLACETVFDGERGYQTQGRALRTARHKYIVYHWGKNREQLFDMEADGGEMVNLAVETRYRDVLDDHRRRLAAWCRQSGDAFRVPGVEGGRQGPKAEGSIRRLAGEAGQG